MLEIISLFIVGQINFLVICYVFSIMLVHKLKFNIRFLINSLIFTAIYIVTNLYFDVTTKSLMINISEILLLNNLYKEKISKSILSTLLNYILMMISETIFTLFFIYYIGGAFTIEFVTKDWFGRIVSNSIILFVTIVLSKLNFIKNIFRSIIKWYEDSQLIKFIIIIVVAFGLIAFFTYQNFVGIHSFIYLVEVNIALITVFIFVIGYFHQKAKNKLILSDYDQLLEYVKTYERVVDEKSKNQHEYKNQLILLKSMIKSNDKNAIDYINGILKKEDEHENYQYLNKLKNLPTGGLKGFILYKIDTMLSKNIIPFVDISDSLSNAEIWRQCEENLQDISRAIGVYLDNAIEAAYNSKEKYVLIDAEYTDNKVIFTFSNTYNGLIDFSRIDKEGYSTKGKGRGHGLALIKEIIDKNDKIEQYREISGIYYVQKLIIKK